MTTGSYIRLAAALAVAALLWGAWHYVDSRGYNRAQAEYATAISAQKAQAAALLASETARVHAAEQALAAITQNQNIKDAENVQTLAILFDRLRAAAGPAGRLRDPHAAGCGGGGAGTPGATATGPGDRSEDSGQTGGLLSAHFTGLLQRMAREADDINAAYQSCRSDAFAVRREVEPEYRLPGM
jgi:hypothetical protein